MTPLLRLGFIAALLVGTYCTRCEGRAQQALRVPSFKSHTELVLVPVVVREHNKPVIGLSKEQFILTDNGRRQEIDVFEAVKDAGAFSAGSRTRDKEFSNFVGGPQSGQGITLIVFDLINTPFLSQPDMARARDAVAKYVTEHVHQRHPTALIFLTANGMQQVHSFTTDPRILVAALKRAGGPTRASVQLGDNLIFSPPPSSEKAVAAEIQTITHALNSASAAMDGLARRDGIFDTLRGFEQIAMAFSGLPGRKSLLWVSYGFECSPADSEMRGRMEYIWHRLSAANVAVYPLDIEGLAFPFERPDPLRNGTPDPRGAPGAATGQSFTLDSRRGVLDTFASFATETGAKPCLNTNDIANCMDRAREDSEALYMLGFYVPSDRRTPGWHKLGVKVRANFTELRHREGYWISAPKEDTGRTWKESMALVKGSPFDFTTLPINVVLDNADDAGANGLRKVTFSLLVAPAFLIDRENEQDSMRLQISAIVLDSRHKYVTELSREIRGTLKPETTENILKNGFIHQDAIELANGTYEIKFLVRDDLTGKLGSVTVPLELR